MLKHLFVFWLSNTKYSTLELIFDSNVIFPNLTTSTKVALTSFSTIISQEKSTYKKFDILEQRIESKLAELKAKGGKGSEETERLTSQVADLQKQLATLNESKTNELKALAEKHQAEQMGMLVDFELAGKNFANKQLDRQINVLTAKTLLNSKLQESIWHP